ncbi:MAG: 2-keto-4-pentenoate hydratase [Hyphomicrobiaceae bacterium]
MTPDEIGLAADVLKSARLENKIIDCIPEAVRPQNIRDAYAVQDRFVEALGWEVGGWFCACTNVSIQKILNLNEPYYARLFTRHIFAEPATLNAADYPPVVLECEFGFRLGRDLPRRSEPYTRGEVESAISEVHPTIEVVAGHLRDWPNQDVWSVIADNGTDGALVYGKGARDWQNLDLVNMPVSLEVNGRVVREGSGRNVLGDPLEAFVWLANARSKDGEGLRAGDIHNTGTTTDIIWIEPGDTATARFEGLGSVSLDLLA